MKQMLEYHTAMVESKHELRDTPFAIPFTTSLEVMVIAAGGHVPPHGEKGLLGQSRLVREISWQ